MKRYGKIFLFLLVAAITMTSCDDLLNVDSDRLAFVEDYQYTGANDTLYSMYAVFSQLQKLSDSYILLGELRADLMDVNDSSDMYLKEINNWNISSNNPYTNNIKDYYSVINNCNYIMSVIDTTILRAGQPRMSSYYAAAKGIRAWTYMQLALNYGKVTYYSKPILSVDDAQKVYPEYTMDQLAPVLIADIEPYKNISLPFMSSTYTIGDAYFPIKFILGDLYLWLGAYNNNNLGYYEKAANEYHDLMYDRKLVISKYLKPYYSLTNNTFNGNYSFVNFMIQPSEQITNIAAFNQFKQVFKLDSLVLNRNISPSAIAVNKWKSQVYFEKYLTDSTMLDTIGDLRLITSVSIYSDYPSNKVTANSLNYVYKLSTMNERSSLKNTVKRIAPYRVSLLYLRYAEAVNRMGKPNLAMAVLKNGMNNATLSNRRAIPESEMATPIPNYMNFTDTRFDFNMGVHSRGCGNIAIDTVYYRIPSFASTTQPKQDSILYVENLIQEELALENAFEGNRFQDLMRFAIRRDDNSYLANIVAAKHINFVEIKAKLMDRTNWYLKY